MKIIHKFICWLIGHNYICVYRHHIEDYGRIQESSQWYCQRCEKTMGYDA
jgi:hypothetical protein